ncbi:hypothetical protein tinsulaeT_11530 [Thalassotalea insulae]|uniref:N-acetyltransferase domain-containing protein n=1 Tax=Thalassotalea insulae TaxID=2056778 RepID=A0ABQ6GPA2_9GAMM|nr:GNAT family N-acetyltransferase [Thalassotalea insulae]GLX77813.1 hypothetical protein tinsulaeT_11530 [Thalassotalea insulae]
MKNMIIRAATDADLNQLKQFEQGVIEAERPFDQCLKPDPIQYYDLEQLISAEQCYLVVAELQNNDRSGKLIASGYARIEQAKPYVSYNFYSYLGFMYVDPEFRGHGVNQQLIKHLADWSSEQGVTMMHLDVFADNLPAIRAYQKAGFSASLLEMRCDITKM